MDIRIVCDQCKAQVESMSVFDMFNQMAVHIVVQCHGEQETHDIPLEFFILLENLNYLEGRAFIKDKDKEEEKEGNQSCLPNQSRKPHPLRLFAVDGTSISSK